jgi:MFS family permease
MALTLASIGAALLTAAITPDWPRWAILLAAGATGLAATSWNGIYLAEIARVAPPGRVGDATSGASILTFLGYVLGPATLGFLVWYTDSYRLAFVLMAALPAAALALLRRPSWAQAH